jgi:hypothetical protein
MPSAAARCLLPFRGLCRFDAATLVDGGVDDDLESTEIVLVATEGHEFAPAHAGDRSENEEGSDFGFLAVLTRARAHNRAQKFQWSR